VKSFLVVLVLVGLTGCQSLEAAGSREEEERFLYLVYGGSVSGDARLARDRMDLPAAAAAYQWSTFGVSDGRVIIQAARTLPDGGPRPAPRPDAEIGPAGCRIYPYRLTGAPSPPEPQSQQVVVAFSCDDLLGPLSPAPASPGRIATAVQPHRWAQLQAIGESGLASGSVRIVEMEHLGSGRFRALVLLRKP
jgi:hypothetical protein